ncbi:MAG: NAD-dependent epimerase/dehydratase family protein [Candidatus Eisenbacteria bacterium]|uniref:NAD-dependent epimerase/dehydratase family protein n=1 Tax=Eiseniibacteriota bacterium TaxID=2212470 RepID=A0A538U028_UNCEI|nr:MAG: NAD-dependent epimerase/dehydratase family protein [Candidatus Eisenbacteria bacterium]
MVTDGPGGLPNDPAARAVAAAPGVLLTMRALVTGASGFAGSNLCRTLRARDWQVRAIARSTSQVDALREAGVEIVAGDIRDPAAVRAAMPGVDVVFHLAAIFREAGKSDAEYHAVNLDGTRHAIEAAAAAGVSRFVHCSTVGVHGDTGAVPANEESPLVEATDSYNRTKLAAERWAREAFGRLGLAGTIVRPTSGYGPGERRYVKLFSGIAHGRFLMIGSGATRMNLAYVDDLCEGMLLAASHPKAVGETFVLGGDENVAIADLARRIAAIVGGSPWRVRVPAWPVVAAAVTCEALCRPLGIEPPLHRRRVGFFTVQRAFDISKAKRVLGYRPRVALDDGLRATADWYRAQGLL